VGGIGTKNVFNSITFLSPLNGLNRLKIKKPHYLWGILRASDYSWREYLYSPLPLYPIYKYK
jgi:hypothetical protein